MNFSWRNEIREIRNLIKNDLDLVGQCLNCAGQCFFEKKSQLNQFRFSGKVTTCAVWGGIFETETWKVIFKLFYSRRFWKQFFFSCHLKYSIRSYFFEFLPKHWVYVPPCNFPCKMLYQCKSDFAVRIMVGLESICCLVPSYFFYSCPPHIEDRGGENPIKENFPRLR